MVWESGGMGSDEVRDEVPLTNLGQPLFDGADATKRDLVDYLDAIRDRIIPELADRPLSVIRVLRGQEPFMQKNVPKYTPPWVRTVRMWAEASHREVLRALQRPPHSALVRQPAGRRISPDAVPARPGEPPDASGARHRSADGGRVQARRPRRSSDTAGPGGRRLGRCGQDQRREGPARVRAS